MPGVVMPGAFDVGGTSATSSLSACGIPTTSTHLQVSLRVLSRLEVRLDTIGAMALLLVAIVAPSEVCSEACAALATMWLVKWLMTQALPGLGISATNVHSNCRSHS